MNRRSILKNTSGSLALAGFTATGFASSKDSKNYSVAVIGHTGRGNYGHGLDKVWLGIPETSVAAVADEDKKGLAEAQERLKTDNGYPDYREMLLKVKPDLVAVCPRHPDQHASMILAAIESGAKGVYVEKPFLRTLEELDSVRSAAQAAGTKIAVAHRNRYHPDLKAVIEILQNQSEKKIGKWLEIRGRGKGDRRGGGEDMWVLGTHVFDLTSYFAGKPLTCSASIYQNGIPATRKDIAEGKEALGPLVGDEIHARFMMSAGIPAYWDSVANDETANRGFGLQIIGSEGSVIVHCDGRPLAHYRAGNPYDPSNQSVWEVIGNTDKQWIDQVHNHMLPCRDLIAAIEDNRDPVCGLEQAGQTIEMVMAVFASHFSGGEAVALPLQERSHPLST